MPIATSTEEQQAKEFLKRAEIRTMKKDLRALREADALKERDKIVKLKTLEEQLKEKKKADEKAAVEKEKEQRQEILERGETQERIAEKDLKNYGTEEERQQIFLLESQRLNFEKQADAIDKEKDPALKLEKNKLLIEQRNWQAKLDSISGQEKKAEDEQKLLAEKGQSSTIPEEKKALEQRRWEIEKDVQETEKRRWEVEKQIQGIEAKIKEIEKSSEAIVAERNVLRDKVLGADKSLREIYSVIMAREEDRRKGKLQEQQKLQEAAAGARAYQREQVQRQEWSRKDGQRQETQTDAYLNKIPAPVRKKLEQSFKAEEEQRKKFMQNVQARMEENKK